MRRALAPAVGLALAIVAPALGRDALGVFEHWAAFRDPAVPRCYALAKAEDSPLHRDYQPYADVGSWPRRGVRGQVHFRLSRKLDGKAPIMLAIGGQRFRLVGGGGDVWAADARMDAAVVAAMRSAGLMTVAARGVDGKPFSNTFPLAGAASALDAAMLGCAGLR